MDASNPLLDLPATPQQPAQPPAQVAESPNLLFGVLRRWPWLLLGLSAGLVLGLLYHMQRAPVFQSSAQLNVVKNRPELITGTTGDARVQYLEDYIAGQVILLRSETILKLAAEKRLDEQGPFHVPPPASIPERFAYMQKQFDVAREKEPGSNTFSNVLLLTFKAAHPQDAPKYLRAIIAAYRDDLTGVSGEASLGQLARLDAQISQFASQQGLLREQLREKEKELRGVVNPATGKVEVPGVSQEELTTVRQRIATNIATQTSLQLRQIVVDKELAEIKSAGPNRAERLGIMARLGIPSERSAFFGDPRDIDSMLASLEFKKSELGARLGPGHPEMISINNQIQAIQKEIQKRGGPLDDELERYRRKLDNEKSSIA
ncbi:MAG TPA: hypothetical protein VLM40_09690, partial [Gemmata sp.]|nr:hypothetical protein [Gemmata sp.]